MTIFARHTILPAAMLLILAVAGFGQTADPAPPVKVRPAPMPRAVPERPRPPFETFQSGERWVAAKPNVKVSLCVNQGSLKINSWDRSEVRVFISSGSKFDLSVMEKDAKTGAPAWVTVNAVGNNGIAGPSPDCLSAEDIEIDAPREAALSIKGRVASVVVDTVRKVDIKTIGGGAQLRNISDGITASVNEGNISIEDSSGPMALDTTNGNILVYGVSPSEAGDAFSARSTSGTISLNQIAHRQIEANSISGSIIFSSDLLDGGSYRLTTQAGTIRMSLPSASNFQFSVTYSGRFNYDLPLKLATENITPGPVKTLRGTAGTTPAGVTAATVTLSAISGSIIINKAEKAAP